MRPILVSACLLGLLTRYDGTAKRHEGVLAYLAENGLIPIPVCPEQIAGLPTPRPATCFADGDGESVLDGTGRAVRTEDGTVVNKIFVRGAIETMKVARLAGCREAILKERSPSCGVHQVCRGGEIVSGKGVAAALLARNGVRLLSEEDI